MTALQEAKSDATKLHKMDFPQPLVAKQMQWSTACSESVATTGLVDFFARPEHAIFCTPLMSAV